MRIGIDARLYGKQFGLGRYTTELVDRVVASESKHTYVLFLPVGHKFVPKKNAEVVLSPYRSYSFGEQVLFPRQIRTYKVDLMHFTHFNVPILYRSPYIVTVHDLILLYHKGTHASTRNPLFYWIKYTIYRLVLGSALARAQKIIAVSDFTAQDVVKNYPEAKNKVVMIYEGLTQFASSKDLTVTDQKSAYLLYVGSAYPHKNLRMLIDAFGEFQKEHSKFSLKLVGPADNFYSKLEAYSRAEHTKNVSFLHGVSDNDLAILYQGASAYIFPSLYEGFGLPGLEAMQYGTPVLASNETCLPEVYGDAALYFDPHSKSDLIRAMQSAIVDEEMRSTLIKRGLTRCQQFSWELMSERIVSLYQNVESQYTMAITHDEENSQDS